MTNKPEWMPENSCGKCDFAPRDNDCVGCQSWDIYTLQLAAQKKLLKYLKEEHYLGASVIDHMLKQIQEAGK
jgi:hypothetical protein